MESRRPILFSFLFLVSLLLSPLALALPVARPSTSLSRRIAEELGSPLGWQRDLDAQKRDVVVPKITSPDSTSVWPVGSTQIVTWDTSDFPPDDQITNPIGRVILGFDSGDSLNLDLEHPLATGFKLRDGKVSVVVPNVTPRKDYLIVLMGDSGNTSPSFAITSISGGTGSTSSSISSSASRPPTPTPTTTPPAIAPSLPSGVYTIQTSMPAVLSSTTITDPIPISGTTITGGDPSATSAFTDTNTLPLTQTTGTAAQANQPSQTSGGFRTAGSCWTLIAGLIVAGVVAL